MMVFVMLISWTSLIVLTFIFPIISLTQNIIIYVVLVSMMFIDLIGLLPETKGKTLQENSIKMILHKKIKQQNGDDVERGKQVQPSTCIQTENCSNSVFVSQ
ncbi:Hypothetical_protein [Hexamita inflata]|uniref:Hypothetical_protein n=1 Tax=Hexamita inflata TaxID=28002 RepID=A0AA86NH99_9EUKA|nr:Hypothetical protein HINF_LOCUS6694 [Hexamita inflata]